MSTNALRQERPRPRGGVLGDSVLPGCPRVRLSLPLCCAAPSQPGSGWASPALPGGVHSPGCGWPSGPQGHGGPCQVPIPGFSPLSLGEPLLAATGHAAPDSCAVPRTAFIFHRCPGGASLGVSASGHTQTGVGTAPLRELPGRSWSGSSRGAGVGELQACSARRGRSEWFSTVPTLAGRLVLTASLEPGSGRWDQDKLEHHKAVLFTDRWSFFLNTLSLGYCKPSVNSQNWRSWF